MARILTIVGAIALALLLASCAQPPPPPPPVDTIAPDTPSALTATAGDASVTLGWLANDEADLAAYNVYRGTVGGSLGKIASVPAGTERFVDSSVSNDTTFLYAIDAEDASGNRSAATDEVAVTPTAGGGNEPATCFFDDPNSLFNGCLFGS